MSGITARCECGLLGCTGIEDDSELLPRLDAADEAPDEDFGDAGASPHAAPRIASGPDRSCSTSTSGAPSADSCFCAGRGILAEPEPDSERAGPYSTVANHLPNPRSSTMRKASTRWMLLLSVPAFKCTAGHCKADIDCDSPCLWPAGDDG